MLHVPQQLVLHTASLVQKEFWGYSCNLLRVIEMHVMVAFYTAHHYLQKALGGWEELHWLRMWCVSCLVWGHMTSNKCPCKWPATHAQDTQLLWTKSTCDFGQKPLFSLLSYMRVYTPFAKSVTSHGSCILMYALVVLSLSGLLMQSRYNCWVHKNTSHSECSHSGCNTVSKRDSNVMI